MEMILVSAGVLAADDANATQMLAVIATDIGGRRRPTTATTGTGTDNGTIASAIVHAGAHDVKKYPEGCDDQ